jgi:glycosyltransferase involved in cell wall biosynthesis
MREDLVSIIIPVFNRGSLISETLNSVLAQTYKNWECIVVDDGSTDNTIEVVQKYKKKDARIKMFHRSKNKLKGGNAARNFGLEMSSGTYINWFDSDDLMEPNFIQMKLDRMFEFPVMDFVVSRSINFQSDKSEEIGYYEQNHRYQLNADNFIREKVHWITDDFFIKREKIGTIKFDEELVSGQEYNFCIRVMAKNKLSGVFINEQLSKRRIHKDSIQERQKKDDLQGFKNKYIVAFKTFREVYYDISKSSKVFFINRILKLSFTLLENKRIPYSYFVFLYYYVKQFGFISGSKLLLYSIYGAK